MGDYEPRSGPESWARVPREHKLTLNLPAKTGNTRETAIPDSKGLKVALLVRPVESAALEAGLAAGTRTVSVFLVNRRKPAPDEVKDRAFAFQAQLEIRADVPLVARPGKGRRERLCPLLPQSARLVRQFLSAEGRQLNDQQPFLQNGLGGRLGRHGARYILLKYLRRATPTMPTLARVGISPHTMRHTKAIHLLQTRRLHAG